MTHDLHVRISRITFHPLVFNEDRSQSHTARMEIEVQVSEAPDICAIIAGDMATQKTSLIRFERESGELICEEGTPEFMELFRRYKDEIEAAAAYLLDTMQEAAICSRYDEEIQE